MSRTVPKGAERGPRDKKLTIYLSTEELEYLDKVASNLGFRSKSQLVVSVIGDLIEGGFSGAKFVMLGRRFSKLIDEAGTGYIDWAQFNPFKKK
jgi:hypothetical protein